MSKVAIMYFKEFDGYTIDEQIRFRDGTLMFDGCLYGQRVKEVRGDWDHEYWIDIAAGNIPIFKKKLWVSWMLDDWLLFYLAWKFPGGTGFREVRDFLDRHKFQYKWWVWD